MDSIFQTAPLELWATAAASICALIAVWLPFWRGLRVAVRAHAMTRSDTKGNSSEIGRALHEVLAESMQQEGSHVASPFLRDASKQYVLNEYEAGFERKLTMYANLLPPLGFIGTTMGLVVLFVSMHYSHAAFEVGAIGLALSSTLFALISYAALEGFKVALYSRLLNRIDEAMEQPIEA